MVFDRDGVTIYLGDCREVLASLDAGSVNTCVTSPPYWGLRDYGYAEQIGLEPTPESYVETMVEVFREVRRVLRDDGTLWLNIGDTYNAYNGGAGPGSKLSKNQTENRPQLPTGYGLQCKSLKPKDLIGIPWRVAFALQADGWYLRQDIIWHKPNPMPESVRDRCTKAHEYIFLLSKSARYYFDQEAIRLPLADASVERLSQPNIENQRGSERAHAGGKTNGNMKAVRKSGNKDRKPASARGVPVDTNGKTKGAVAGSVPWEGSTANRRTIWTVPTRPYSGAHFAVFPPALIEPCILAGAPEGGVVLDPFLGSGTTAEVAKKNGCRFVGCEMNADYFELCVNRFKQRSLF